MANGINDLFIVPDLDASLAEVSFTAPERFNGGNWAIRDGSVGVSDGKLPAAEKGKITFSAPVPNYKKWDIDNPFLYVFAADFEIAGKRKSVEVKFGMRSIRVSGRDILVNGEKFYARGYIRGRQAHDHPNLENLPLSAYYEKNIAAAKSYGFNLIRFHSRVPPEECFEVADRLGMFIHVELRDYFGKYQKERASMRDGDRIIDENGWKAMILETRNHPSLMAYCIGNEIRNPGRNPFIKHIAGVTKALDPTRLFIDTCAHGEFDRKYVDFDVQHMSYFYPFGKDYDMFDNTYNWSIYGSCEGRQLEVSDAGEAPTYKITRAIHPTRPILAHEICHYIAYRDLDALEAKFAKTGAEKPWWLDETRKLFAAKGLAEEYPCLLAASKRFQFLSWKLAIEAARRSRLLSGFHFLQFSDTERYENSNGIVDCFDDDTGVDRKEFLKFNGDSALLSHLPRRTFFEREKVRIPVSISHFSQKSAGRGDFYFELLDLGTGQIVRSGGLADIDLEEKGLREICGLELTMPESADALALRLTVRLKSGRETAMENDWNLWSFPDRQDSVPAIDCAIDLDDVPLSARFPRIKDLGPTPVPGKLFVANRFSEKTFAHLKAGGDALVLYRVPETRDRERPAEKETYYLPAVWDRLKGVIWDRGHNCGAVIRHHPAFAGFPHDGFVDLQFHGLIDDCDKIDLDDFPVPVVPIAQGADRPVRDRYDVHTYKLSEFQPEHTARRFAYAFELKVGAGRLFVTGFNFTGLEKSVPERRRMLESILRYVASDAFDPAASVDADILERYLLEKGAAPRLRERKMTQYWQLNAEPLESAKYWREAEEYIAGTLNRPNTDTQT